MAEILYGKPVADEISKKTEERAVALKGKGTAPTLAVLRVGEREDDLSYERGLTKRAEKTGIAVKVTALPENVSEEEFFSVLEGLNADKNVHGILMFRPLPAHIDGEKARKMLVAEKDIDGCTDLSLAGVFTGKPLGFAPCTAEAAMEILHYYGVCISGKKVAVLGRSLVVGRPLAMMLMHENATVTVCHTRTVDVPSVTRGADIIIAATGQMESVGKEYLREGQTVIDVGISWSSEKNKLCGDVLFEDAEKTVGKITPVPGGVGSVTTSILMAHVAEAAERQTDNYEI